MATIGCASALISLPAMLIVAAAFLIIRKTNH